jgi:hypothetical protein
MSSRSRSVGSTIANSTGVAMRPRGGNRSLWIRLRSRANFGSRRASTSQPQRGRAGSRLRVRSCRMEASRTPRPSSHRGVDSRGVTTRRLWVEPAEVFTVGGVCDNQAKKAGYLKLTPKPLSVNWGVNRRHRRRRCETRRGRLLPESGVLLAQSGLQRRGLVRSCTRTRTVASACKPLISRSMAPALRAPASPIKGRQGRCVAIKFASLRRAGPTKASHLIKRHPSSSRCF